MEILISRGIVVQSVLSKIVSERGIVLNDETIRGWIRNRAGKMGDLKILYFVRKTMTNTVALRPAMQALLLIALFFALTLVSQVLSHDAGLPDTRVANYNELEKQVKLFL